MYVCVGVFVCGAWILSIFARLHQQLCVQVVFCLTYMRSRRAYRLQHNEAQHCGSCHAQASLKPHFGILSHHAKLPQISVNDWCISQERITSKGQQMQLVSRGWSAGRVSPTAVSKRVCECINVCVLEAHVKDTNSTKRERATILVTILVRYATLTLIPKVVPTCACRTVSRRLEIAYI